MKIQLIRNATLKLHYAGKVLLVDPMLCPKDSFPPFVKGLQTNPTVELPLGPAEVLAHVHATLVTHSHPDHFGPLAQKLLPKDLPLFCTPADAGLPAFKAFPNRTVVEEKLEWQGISIQRIAGQHGSGPVLQFMGEVSGYILRAEGEPSLYIVGDSILTEEVRKTVEEEQPDIIVCNSGGGILPGFEKFPVLMDESATVAVAKAAPNAIVLAVHLESIDFCRVTRKSMRECAAEKGIAPERLLIPRDGEEMTFQA